MTSPCPFLLYIIFQLFTPLFPFSPFLEHPASLFGHCKQYQQQKLYGEGCSENRETAITWRSQKDCKMGENSQLLKQAQQPLSHHLCMPIMLDIEVNVRKAVRRTHLKYTQQWAFFTAQFTKALKSCHQNLFSIVYYPRSLPRSSKYCLRKQIPPFSKKSQTRESSSSKQNF